MAQLAESPYSPTLPTFQTTWDSTSLGWYKKCPRYYQFCMLGGWISRSKSIHLLFGGWYASGVERYAHARADGMSHIESMHKMVKWVLNATGSRACGQCKGSGVLLHGDVVNDCPTCDGSGDGVEFIPWESGDTTKNRYTLVRSLVWNVEDRLGTPFQTMILADGRPAVELSFSFPLFELNGEVIYYAGHMDEVVEFEGRSWVKDDKTTKNQLDANYRQQFSPDNQMSGYTVAGKVVLKMPIEGVLVRATQVGVNFNRFTTFPVPRPQAVLDEWTIDAQIVIGRAREDAERGYWPMNDKACFGCEFRRVCTVSKSHRDAWLRDDFIQRPRWNPLEVRGDV